MIPRTLVAGLLVGFSVTACAPAERADIEQLTESYREFVDSWFAAFNGRDVAALMALYGSDATRMPPGGPAVEGGEAIRAAFQEQFTIFSSHAEEGGSDDIRFAGDWAMERGWYTFEGTLAETGDRVAETGKYVVVSQRQPDGSWQLLWEIWNSDEPPPGQG